MKSIQEILGDQMPSDLSKPVVITADALKDCDFNTMPEGLRLQLQRDNHRLYVRRVGEKMRNVVIAELAGDPEGVCEFAFDTAMKAYQPDSSDDEEDDDLPLFVVESQCEAGVDGVLTCVDAVIAELMEETKTILKMALDGVELHSFNYE